LSSNSNLTKIGIITAILVAYGAVFFSLIKIVNFPPLPELGISLGVFGVLLTIGIFVIQWRISSKQDTVLERVSGVLKKQQAFEARQTEELVRDIRQWLSFINSDIEKIEEHVVLWKNNQNISVKNKYRAVIDSYHNHTIMEIDYLQNSNFLASSNLSQTLIRQLKRLKTSYNNGPLFFDAQNMVDMISIRRIKSIIKTINSVLDNEPNN